MASQIKSSADFDCKFKIIPMKNIYNNEKYLFELFINKKSIKNCRTIFDKYLQNNYELDIIDIYEQPEKNIKEQIIAIPTLIKKTLLPEVRLTEDLSNTEKVVYELIN
jgi:circadian clock protein KaiB